MRYLLTILNWLADCLFAWFTPSWRRKGCEARNILTRYYNFNKPHLTEEKATQIRDFLDRLKEGLLYWRREEVTRTTEQVNNYGEGLQGFRKGTVIEIVESIFVITVVFLGIRTYYAQPFRIPTGSMQPSLNGITIEPLAEGTPFPSLTERCLQAITRGSSYSEIIADSPKQIINLKTERYWLILTRTRIYFDDGSTATVPCASGAVAEYLVSEGKIGRRLQAGETIIRARFDAGDMVVVNRMAYHFRKPKRGETFVFDTRGINTNVPSAMPDQSNASNYIKRLCGLPGDIVGIDSPYVTINGQRASEPTMEKVASCRPPFNPVGYNALNKQRDAAIYYQAYMTEGNAVVLRKNLRNPNYNEYLALGDNTINSKDSRYWGPVRQFNVLGPAFLVLWPFTDHWGNID